MHPKLLADKFLAAGEFNFVNWFHRLKKLIISGLKKSRKLFDYSGSFILITVLTNRAHELYITGPRPRQYTLGRYKNDRESVAS